MDAGVKGLHPSIETFRRAGIGRHLHRLELRLLQGTERPARGQNPPPQGQQALCQRDEPHLVIHRDQCRRHVRPLNP